MYTLGSNPNAINRSTYLRNFWVPGFYKAEFQQTRPVDRDSAHIPYNPHRRFLRRRRGPPVLEAFRLPILPIQENPGNDTPVINQRKRKLRNCKIV